MFVRLLMLPPAAQGMELEATLVLSFSAWFIVVLAALAAMLISHEQEWKRELDRVRHQEECLVCISVHRM